MQSYMRQWIRESIPLHTKNNKKDERENFPERYIGCKSFYKKIRGIAT